MVAPLLSIVAGTLDRRDQLVRLVDSVLRETRVPFTLYITDAGSTDGSIEYLKSIASDQIRPVFVGKKLGQARAYNDVFMQVATPYVCWVSDDNEIVDHGLDKAVDILERDRKIGMVGLKVRDKEGPFTKAPYIGGISSTGILNVNQGVLPTQVMHAVGGFSEHFRDYGIDPDLTAKVLFLGFDIVYTRDVAIHHFRNWSADHKSKEYKIMMERQVVAKEKYEAIYGKLAKPSKVLALKKRSWELAGALLSKRINLSMHSEKPILGSIPRDYYNTLMCRYISPFDLFTPRNKAYHLRQRYRGKWKLAGDSAAVGQTPTAIAGNPKPSPG
jgi:GT2 family glycosyltransferase